VTPRSWKSPVARYSSLKESGRLRVIGAIVLVLGMAGAGVFYWINAHPAGPSMDDLLPGYARAQARGVGAMMGHFGLIMTEWQDTLALPGTQALIIAAVSALFASYFFRAAWVLDDNERDRAQLERDR
jgi:uncharacterized protein YjeT (DUF2065 family)